MSRGKFIAFEGIDGCGKSTQISRVAKLLLDSGVKPVLTREPGGTQIGEAIRSLLIDPRYEEMSDTAELLLYLASRAQHVKEKIAPALGEGRVVLCDRFQAATFSYQGYGRGISLDLLDQLNRFSTGGVKPDLTFVLDISVECSMHRLAAMNKSKDRLESSSVQFFQKIRQGYKAQAQADPGIVLLDGERDIDELTELIYSRISQELMQSCH
ncbi:Thymidylate kinase [Chitinispirillum alkaliphilum]|nr:Thymidylate kinase [Chitinispirillum alkaliphilum]